MVIEKVEEAQESAALLTRQAGGVVGDQILNRKSEHIQRANK